MPLATKNGSLILKDGKVAENCACCSRTCSSVISAVRMKLTTVAEFQDSTVAGGRRTQVNVTGDFASAQAAALGYFNSSFNAPFPQGRFATYSQNKKPSQGVVSPSRVSPAAEQCFCNYGLQRFVSVGSRSALETWAANFQMCEGSSQIKLVSVTVPYVNVLFFTQPDIGMDRVGFGGSSGFWSFFVLPASFESGYCSYSITEFRVNESAAGGLETGASSVSDTTSPNISKPRVSGGTVTFMVSNSVTIFRQVWYSEKDFVTEVANKCAKAEQMTSSYTVQIEVDLL